MKKTLKKERKNGKRNNEKSNYIYRQQTLTRRKPKFMFQKSPHLSDEIGTGLNAVSTLGDCCCWAPKSEGGGGGGLMKPAPLFAVFILFCVGHQSPVCSFCMHNSASGKFGGVAGVLQGAQACWYVLFETSEKKRANYIVSSSLSFFLSVLFSRDFILAKYHNSFLIILLKN